MAERFPIESLKVVGNSVYHVAPDGQMFFVRSLAEDPTANTDVFAATPPRADDPSFYAATPEPDSYFGQQAVGMAAPYLETARNLALSANTMTPDKDSYVPESIQRMGNYATNMGLAGLSAAMAPVYGAAGAVGDVAKAAGVPRSEALVRDLGSMLDTAGVLPEGRILGAMADAGAVGSMAAKAPALYADAIGNARALAQGDLEFMRGRGLPENAVGVGADVPKASGMGDNGGPPIDIFEETPSAPAPRQRYVDPATGRYSKAFEAAQDLTQNVMTAAQARAGLIKQGVSEEELLYTGFDNWLQGKDKVTKDEVVNILADVAINKSGQGSLPFNRITQESTGIIGGDSVENLRDQVIQDRFFEVSRSVDEYTNTLRSDLMTQGFEPISIDNLDDFLKTGDLIAKATVNGKYVDPPFLRRFKEAQDYMSRGYNFDSSEVRQNIRNMTDSYIGGYAAPDGSIFSESRVLHDQFPDHETPRSMYNRLEDELRNSVEQMDGQQVADYLGVDLNDFESSFNEGTTAYADNSPKGLMDYKENRYGYNDIGRGVLSGSQRDLETKQYREGHFSSGSQDENRMYHTRVGMLNTPEGKAYHMFEAQSDIGQKFRDDPSRFQVTGTKPVFEIPKAERKKLQEYVAVGKKVEDLMSQQRVAEEVLLQDLYFDMNTGKFKKDEEGYEELSSHIRDIRAKLRPLNTKLTELATNNQVLDDMQRFYGRPDMSMLYGDALDIKAIEEALAGTLTPKPGAPGSPKGKTLTRPFTTSTNRWVPAALKDELFNAANSDAEWFSLPMGKDVETWTYGKSAGHADFYENIVPTQLKKLLKKEYGLDVPIEKIKAEGFLIRDNPTYEVNAIRLTPELRKMILEQGFSTFREGGPVVGSSLANVDVFALQ